MKMSFDMQMPDFTKAQAETEEGMKQVLFRSMIKMEEIAKFKAPVDTGNLRNRIHLNPTQPGAEEYILSDGVEYGVYVEYGTKPHHVPLTPLQGWAKRNLGNEGAAFAVSKKISIRGTPAQPFFRPAMHEVQVKWIHLIKKQVFGSE